MRKDRFVTKVLLSSALALGSAALPVMAAPAATPTTYAIKTGDTLIGISQRLLARPADWRKLARLNRIRDPLRLQPGSLLQIPAGLLKAAPLSAEIDTLAGTVSTASGRQLAVGDKLAVGETLISSADGYAALRLPDGSRLVIKPGSRLRIETLQRERRSGAQASRVQLDSGRIENEVAPQRGPAARYEIHTPTAVIGVRGTRFRSMVDEDGKNARLEVTEGLVAARGQSGAARALAAGFGSLIAPGGVGAPVKLLAAPQLAPDALFERPLVRLPLPQQAGVAGWRISVADAAAGAAGFATPRFDALLSGQEARIPALPDGDYRYRLRGVDAAGLEGLDGEGGFRLKARPEPPIANAPVPEAKLRSEGVEFRWTQQSEAQRYRLQVARDAGFADIVAARDDLTETRASLQLPLGRYYWRLASIKGEADRGPWGDAWRFELKALQGPPEAPKIDSDQLSFAWPGEAGQRFEFEMASEPSFAQPQVRRQSATNTLELPRPPAGLWYIRVRATDADGYVGQWSSTQQFEVPRDWRWLWLLPLLGLIPL
ncbi:FecR domain-containing protein [Uliginosibacterium sediminicola]|uniref:FecR domain-containing protein n=1 Tax=Uliginosibacterium sediminicola TaxID=2024550 RepID=A0ABU9YVA1_9RHOO